MRPSARTGLRALLKPEWFAAKGRVLPRPARPPPKLEGRFDQVGGWPGWRASGDGAKQRTGRFCASASWRLRRWRCVPKPGSDRARSGWLISSVRLVSFQVGELPPRTEIQAAAA